MKTIKRATAIMLTITILLGCCIEAQAWPFSKKLATPEKQSQEWLGEKLKIEWKPVKNADSYKVTYNGKSFSTKQPYVSISPTRDSLIQGKINGSIQVQALPATNDKKNTESKTATISFQYSMLPAPDTYAYYWNGDVVQVLFSGVNGAVKYDINAGSPNNPYYINETSYMLPVDYSDIQSGYGHVNQINYVRAIPSNTSTNPSVAVSIPVSIDINIANDLFLASFLSQEQLEYWMQEYGLKPEADFESYSDYSVIKTTIDEGSHIKDSISSELKDNAQDIISSGLEEEGSLKDKLKAAGEEALTNALRGGIKGLLKDYQTSNSSKYIYYFYDKGGEIYSAVGMIYQYPVANNTKPDFTGLYYDKDSKCYYEEFPEYNRIARVSYNITKNNGEDYWQIIFEPLKGPLYERFTSPASAE